MANFGQKLLEWRFCGPKLLDELAGQWEVIQVFDINSEEKDNFEDVCKDDEIGLVGQIMVIEGCKKVLMEFAYLIYVGKELVALLYIEYLVRKQTHFEIGND